MAVPDEPRSHRRLRTLRRLTHGVIVWERAVLGCWRSLCWVGFFVGLWLWEVPFIFGQGGGIVAALIFWAGLGFFLWQDGRHVQWPHAHAVDRRLEASNNLSHRPLAHLNDELANPQLERTQDLWRTGRQQAQQMLGKLRPPMPKAQLAEADPAALRIFVLIFVILGFVNAGPLWAEHVRAGLWPFAGATAETAEKNNITLWITPPGYTHLRQTIVQSDGAVTKAVIVPAGSMIKARVQDGLSRPVLRIGHARLRFERQGVGDVRSWTLTTAAIPGNMIRISQSFLTRLRVPIHYHVDQPPRIALKNPPTALPNGGLQTDVIVHDDYGVTALGLSMTADPAVQNLPLGGPIENWRSVSTAGGRDVEIKPVFDLTWHPWAGLPVLITLRARDAQGQMASLPPLHVTLPERPFYNPVAQTLIALRKRLALMPRAAANVAYDLETLLSHPEAFRYDHTVFLAIRSAASRLIWDSSDAGVASVIAELWDTALRVEDGNLSLSARALQQAQADLQKLLSNGQATPNQVAAATEHLRDALNEYLSQVYQGLQRRMAQNGIDPSKLTPEMFAHKMNADAMNATIDKLRAQALAGNRDAAQQLLSQLQQMTDQMNPASARMPPQLQAMFKSLQGLNELIGKQTDLKTRTVKAQTPVAPADQAKILQELQAEQDGLRRTLGALMVDAGNALGKIPKPMQEAELQMRAASEALAAGKPDKAAASQQQALNQLNQTGDGMKQQLQAMLKQMTLMALGMGKTDPLGRPTGDGGENGADPYGDNVKIPDQAERRQIQEILKVLRQRSGELDRPDYERDYYDRLLQQF